MRSKTVQVIKSNAVGGYQRGGFNQVIGLMGAELVRSRQNFNDPKGLLLLLKLTRN